MVAAAAMLAPPRPPHPVIGASVLEERIKRNGTRITSRFGFELTGWELIGLGGLGLLAWWLTDEKGLGLNPFSKIVDRGLGRFRNLQPVESGYRAPGGEFFPNLPPEVGPVAAAFPAGERLTPESQIAFPGAMTRQEVEDLRARRRLFSVATMGATATQGAPAAFSPAAGTSTPSSGTLTTSGFLVPSAPTSGAGAGTRIALPV